MDRTITVTGSGRSSAVPDIAVISGELSGECSEYSEAVSSSAEAVSALRKAVGDAGFDMDGLMTRSFSVNPVYKYDKDGVSQFCGYRFSHSIEMTMDSDNETVGKVLGAMAASDKAPEFRVSYRVSDESKVMSEARQAAVRDAKHKAKELASAADVKLGDIVSISYVSEGRSGACSPRMLAAVNMDVVPKDVEFSDSVTIQWCII